ncbi:sensor histidine kinase [Candidatus Magnetaquicoccus inordinatus]|uniref:sensor histidine kinase n=1 Tax=Candidatus Magnetaquicoccus inordinatus TaxID=2496818 RepID=UPI00102B5355|nr:sensor histidine kinase [Candidatus Magnetaquicoccus inordinatus]
MIWHWLLPFLSIAYLGLLFAVAYYADRRAAAGRSLVNNSTIYTLSIAVYCTSWTYYGSVGRAAVSGVGFLPIFLGPTLMAALWWSLLGKIITIAKRNHITSIADFISSRYGKSPMLGGMVTLFVVVGIMPYIALQLKAVAGSLEVLSFHLNAGWGGEDSSSIWNDTALYVALILALFSILFGTRHLDASERHEGMVTAIAFESLVKLGGFLAVGLFATYGLFDGFADLFGKAMADPQLQRLFTFDVVPGGYASWFSMTFLAMMAILFLPRQFQVLVVENVNSNHLRQASWLFPLYLLAFNLFVLPIALAGRLLLDGSMDPDTFVLTLPIYGQQDWLALLVYIGGLSAATSMVIVEAIAMSTMVSNDLIIPLLLRLRSSYDDDYSSIILTIRRAIILILLLLGYFTFRMIGESHTLVSIGIISFAAVAQFAPPILLGIYWQGASRRGAMGGLLAGFLVWTHTLLLASFAKSGWMDSQFLTDGPWGIGWLRPQALFGLEAFDPITHSIFWSMMANIGVMIILSLMDRQSAVEQIQALNFVNVFEKGAKGGDEYLWSGFVSVGDLKKLLGRFVGTELADEDIVHYIEQRHLDLDDHAQAPAHLVAFTERRLTGAIGSASARVMVSSVVKGEALDLIGVMRILDETSQVIEYSQRLELKSRQLEAASRQLQEANQRLQELDRLKDEFISTVSHELRTPLTSIRAFSEILHDNDDMDVADRQKFTEIIIKETERLTRLVNQILDLAKMESGKMEWHLATVDLTRIVREAVDATRQLFHNKNIALQNQLGDDPCPFDGDPDKIMQVVINLLSNAVKFCSADQGVVTLQLLSNEEGIGLTVSDNGAGIPHSDLERIFEKFHQVQSDAENLPLGTGLGLTICRRIIERHQGRIWAESILGEGATFHFIVPRQQPAMHLSEEEEVAERC